MSERRHLSSMPTDGRPPAADQPEAEIVEFIRFCHARRSVNWPEMYDQMCAVAARAEFRGWGHDELAARGVTFSLGEMPRLAGWVRSVIATQPHDPAAETDVATAGQPSPMEPAAALSA